jgi:hypothetical protein
LKKLGEVTRLDGIRTYHVCDLKRAVEANIKNYERAKNSSPELADNLFTFPFDSNYEFKVEVERSSIEKYLQSSNYKANDILIEICLICSKKLEPLYILLEDLK